MKMLKQEELNKLCEGLDKYEKKDGIKIIIDKGYCRDEATKHYNAWRNHYVRTLVNIT